MRTTIKRHPLTMALLTGLMVLVGFAGSAFAHDPVTLRNFSGAPLAAGVVPQAAYSAKATCGLCHDYDKIEQHSYHAQIGANQWQGWSPWNPNSASAFKRGVAAKGKNWVQSPGHLGKW